MTTEDHVEQTQAGGRNDELTGLSSDLISSGRGEFIICCIGRLFENHLSFEDELGVAVA